MTVKLTPSVTFHSAAGRVARSPGGSATVGVTTSVLAIHRHSVLTKTRHFCAIFAKLCYNIETVGNTDYVFGIFLLFISILLT